MSDQIFLRFAKGQGDANADPMVWGGKGAGLAKMAAKGYPVPPGFTITTELCKVYQEQPEAVMDAIMTDIGEHLEFIKSQFGYMPLLSVRSGAPISMPGMMDTILNVGLSENNAKEWRDRIGLRAATDSFRRLWQMMGTTVYGLPHEAFEHALAAIKEQDKVSTDAELNEEGLAKVLLMYSQIYDKAQIEIPATLEDQLRVCIDAVFKSWMGPNAVEYRKIEGIDESLGTAVTVQAMVFGNMNDDSGSGVLFTRNPSTGEKKIMAEYLVNAQGEDVVAGIRTPDHLELSEGPLEKIWQIRLRELCGKLEEDYRDMVDAEFTVQDGKLFMLQSRVGKRSAQAAFKIAMDLRDEGVITEQEMFSRVKRKHLVTVRKPSIDPKFDKKPILTGIGASMGIAVGEVAFTSQSAVEKAAQGKKVILVTEETTPDDIAGMAASVGILTRTGGATSHAAVVARGMDKPCVVGCTGMTFVTGGLAYDDVKNPSIPPIEDGEEISIDGATGRVWLGKVPVLGGEMTKDVAGFIDQLLAAHNIVPQFTKPVTKGSVVIADWVYKSEEEVAELVGELKKVAKEGAVVLDITMPHQFGGSADDEIWNIAGPAFEEQMFIEKVLHPILHAGAKVGVWVTGGTADTRELFEMKGYKVLPQVFTLAQLFEKKGMCGIKPELIEYIGKDKFKETMQKFNQTGLFTGQVMTNSLPPVYAALELLGE